MTQKLVRATSEMEGRVTEVWTLVDEEDELEQWPENGELSAVGKPAPRQDGPLRAAGRANYTVDIRLPGMLHAAVLRSPVARARVKSLDLEAARRADGVRAVVGPESTVAYTPTLCPPQPILTSEPAYAGQPIALVAADTPEQARAALDALALELEVLPHALDPQEAVSELRFATDPIERGRGDVDAALAGADVMVELEVETPDQLQTPLEPHAAVARWDGDELTVWLSTQGMFDARRELAEAFDLPRASRPGDRGVHRRRVRGETRWRLRGDRGRRARSADRPAGAAREQPTRGTARRRAQVAHASRPSGWELVATGRSPQSRSKP